MYLLSTTAGVGPQNRGIWCLGITQVSSSGMCWQKVLLHAVHPWMSGDEGLPLSAVWKLPDVTCEAPLSLHLHLFPLMVCSGPSNASQGKDETLASEDLLGNILCFGAVNQSKMCGQGASNHPAAPWHRFLETDKMWILAGKIHPACI